MCYDRKRQGPMAEKYCCSEFLMNFLWGRVYEDQRRQWNGQT